MRRLVRLDVLEAADEHRGPSTRGRSRDSPAALDDVPAWARSSGAPGLPKVLVQPARLRARRRTRPAAGRTRSRAGSRWSSYLGVSSCKIRHHKTEDRHPRTCGERPVLCVIAPATVAACRAPRKGDTPSAGQASRGRKHGRRGSDRGPPQQGSSSHQMEGPVDD